MSNKTETIKIQILGHLGTGKSTIINGLCSKKIKLINEEILCSSFENDDNQPIIDDFLDMDNFDCDDIKINLTKISNNADIYVIVTDLPSIIENNYQLDTINKIKKTIENNNYGYMLIIVNKCDNFVFDQDNSVIIENEKEKEYYQKFCASNDIKIIPLKAHEMYLYRTLYFCEDESVDQNTEKELCNIVKLQVGEMMFKKMKNNLSTLKEKQEFLKKKFDLDEIYENAMIETGYSTMKKEMNNLILQNYDNIIKQHIKCNIDDIKDSNNIDYICKELENMIDKSKQDDMEIKDIISNFILNNLIKIISNFELNPITINNNIIKNISNINTLMKNKWEINLLDLEIEKLINIRNDNLVDIFVSSFDNDILKEIKDKLSCDMLTKSLSNSVKEMDFDTYLKTFSDISRTLDYDINYIAIVSLFLIDFINEFFGNQIIKMRVNKILVFNDDNDMKFIMWNVLNNINNKNREYQLLCDLDEFNNQNKIFDKFYKNLVDILDEKKYKDIHSTSDIKNYIYDLHNKYKKLSGISTFAKKINSEYSSIIGTIREINRCHENDTLEKMINTSEIKETKIKEIKSGTVKETKKSYKNVHQSDSDESDSDNENDSEQESIQLKKKINKNIRTK
jgi:hypothetical protein